MEIKASARALSGGKVRLSVRSTTKLLKRSHHFTLGPEQANKLGLALLDAGKNAEEQANKSGTHGRIPGFSLPWKR